MLVDFSIGNFRSIGEQQTLSMVASSDTLLSGHTIHDELILGRRNLRLLRNGLIYGANASGKSNVCRAMRCLQSLVTDSATKLNHGDSLPGISAFRLHSGFLEAASRFEIRILIDGHIYRYGVEATSEAIHREWLYATGALPRSKEVLLFEREGPDKDLWRFGPSLRGNTKNLRAETRATNCLLLSRSVQNSFEQLEPLYDWFANGLQVVAGSFDFGKAERALGCDLRNGKVDPNWIAAVCRVADFGVEDASPSEPLLSLAEAAALTGFSGGMLAALNYDASIDTNMHLLRRQTDTDILQRFDGDEESAGTHRFVVLCYLMRQVFAKGSALFVDELEASLHPLLTRELIDLMNDDALGSSGAQFIVTTHDSNLLDLNRLRRDQIWFADKAVDHQTEVYCLYDMDPKPKLDSALERQYLSSRFGGVPALGNLRLVMANDIREVHERQVAATPAKG